MEEREGERGREGERERGREGGATKSLSRWAGRDEGDQKKRWRREGEGGKEGREGRGGRETYKVHM